MIFAGDASTGCGRRPVARREANSAPWQTAHPRRAPHRMQQQVSGRNARPDQVTRNAHARGCPKTTGVRIRKRHYPGIKDRNRQRRKSEQKSDDWPRQPHVKQRIAVVNRRTNPNERAQVFRSSRRGKKIRIARGNSVVTASKKMSQFMSQQNADQSKGEWRSGEQQARMGNQTPDT